MFRQLTTLLLLTTTLAAANGQDERSIFPGRAFPMGTRSGCFGMVVEDLDLDGHFDVAVTMTYGQVGVRWGDGQGKLVDSRTYNLGSTGQKIAAGDFASPGGGGPDGLPDLIIRGGTGYLIGVLCGLPDRDFAPPENRVPSDITLGLVDAGDFDGDTVRIQDGG